MADIFKNIWSNMSPHMKHGAKIMGVGGAVLGGLGIAGKILGVKNEEESHLGEKAAGAANWWLRGALVGAAGIVAVKGVAIGGMALKAKKAGLSNSAVWQMGKASLRTATAKTKVEYGALLATYGKKSTEALRGKTLKEGLYSSTAARVMAPGLELAGAVGHTADWLGKNWIKDLKRFEPGAVGLAALTAYEGYEIGKSALEGDVGGVVGGIASFAGAKYAYMGYHKFLSTSAKRKKSFETIKSMKWKDWAMVGTSISQSINATISAGSKAAILYPQFVRVGTAGKTVAEEYGRNLVRGVSKEGKAVKDSYLNAWDNVSQELKDKFLPPNIQAEMKKASDELRNVKDKVKGAGIEDIQKNLDVFKKNIQEKNYEKESIIGKKIFDKIANLDASKVKNWKDSAFDLGEQGIEKAKKMKSATGNIDKDKLHAQFEEKLENVDLDKLKKMKDRGKGIGKDLLDAAAEMRKAGDDPEKLQEVVGGVYEKINAAGLLDNFQDIGRVARDVAGNVQNSGINPFDGFSHGGLASAGRKTNTPFGSKYDRVKVLARMFGETLESFTARPGFQRALSSAREVKRFSPGSFGETALMRGKYGRHRFEFVKKTISPRARSRAEAAGINADFESSLDLYREGSIMKPFENSSFAPSVYRKAEDELLMEAMPGKPLYKMRPRDFPSNLTERINQNIDEFADRGVWNNDIHSGNVMYDKSTDRLSMIDYGRALDASIMQRSTIESSMKAQASRTITGHLNKTPGQSIQFGKTDLQNVVGQRLEDVAGDGPPSLINRPLTPTTIPPPSGLDHRGIAASMRKSTTDFESPYRGLGSSVSKQIAQSISGPGRASQKLTESARSLKLIKKQMNDFSTSTGTQRHTRLAGRSFNKILHWEW